MPLPESSLSIICTSIFNFVRTGVNAAANNISVTMGAPAEIADDDSQHRINLFFYRFEPSGFHSSAHPNDPWRIRLFCLISAFGILEDGVLAGENDLRMLGEVMRIFRETPVLNAVTVAAEEVRLQAVFSPATEEQINQIWSTQGDATYRPSVVYEMALASIMPSTLRVESSLVGAIGKQVRAGQARRFAPFQGIVQGPPVRLTEVDIGNPQWAPELCWVYQGDCAHSLSFDVTSPEFAAFTPQIWLAGDSGSSVNLVWEIWDSAGWRSTGASIAATPFNATIDPDNVPTANPPFPMAVVNPVTIPPGEHAAQGLLYATRTVILVVGQPPIEVRSNPLLLSMYRP